MPPCTHTPINEYTFESYITDCRKLYFFFELSNIKVTDHLHLYVPAIKKVLKGLLPR